jgi:hypothetical protein
MKLLDIIPTSDLLAKPVRSGGTEIITNTNFPVRRQITITVFNDSANISFGVRQGNNDP